jgi:predicted  nucleic acid-binding Zn-ribbon protein
MHNLKDHVSNLLDDFIFDLKYKMRSELSLKDEQVWLVNDWFNDFKIKIDTVMKEFETNLTEEYSTECEDCEDYETEVTDLKDEISDLEAEIKSQREQIEALVQDKIDLEAEIELQQKQVTKQEPAI